MNFWSPKTLRSLVLPGALFLLAACVVFQGAFGSIPSAAVHFYFYSVFVAGLALAWRFHSSRILFALLTLFLAQRALEFFSSGRIAAAGPGRIALEAVAFLLPLNFIAFSVFRERGLVFPAIMPRMALLFLESVFVAIICRPGELVGPALLHSRFLGRLHWTPLPALALLAFIAALAVLMVRLVLYRKPTESGLLWALLATFLSFQVGAVGPAATAYLATAGLILLSSIIENTYFLAYHDELTSLPARRAFNDALLRLEEPYAVAVVDIDHFKRFNDTYGHETGDQVLRLVAAKLAGVTGGGCAYRVGGEEFSILFPGKSVKEAHASSGIAALGDRSGRVPRPGRPGAPGHSSRAGCADAGFAGAGGPQSEWTGFPQSRPAKHRTPGPAAPASSGAKESSCGCLRSGESANLGNGQHRRRRTDCPFPLGRASDSGCRSGPLPGQAVRTQSGRAFLCAARGPAPAQHRLSRESITAALAAR